MATDYFSHSVYGVELSGEAAQLFSAEYSAAQMRVVDELNEGNDPPPGREEALGYWEDEFEPSERWEQVYSAMDRTVLDRIRVLVGAPQDAHFWNSGDEDDRPGRCATDADVILCGYGPWDVLDLMRERFADPSKVHLHTWVEAG